MIGWLRRLFRWRREEEFVALVLFLSTPRVLSLEPVRSAIGRATGTWLEAEALEEVETSYFRFWVEGYQITLCTLPTPYISNPEEFAQSIPDLRLRDALARHQGCILVDVWVAPTGKTRRDGIGIAGRILAEFFDDTALSVYSRVTHRHNLVDEELREQFSAGHAIGAMETMTFDGIAQADAEDPEMIAAVEEARRRWPEFVNAWQTAQDREPFLVKVRFGEDDAVEHMWVRPVAPREDGLTGVLVSKPFRLPRPREGDQVEVRVDEITDWIFVAGEEPVGGFTEAIVRRSH